MTGQMLVFDVDDVLADSAPGMAAAISRRTGRLVTVEMFDRYLFHEIGQMSLPAFLQLLVDDEVLERADPFPGAAAAVACAAQAGLKIAAVTSRKFHPRAEQVTRSWFERHAIALNELRVVDGPAGKSSALQSLASKWDVIGFCDDHIANLAAVAAAGVQCGLALMDRPWNADSESFHRVQDAGEFVQSALTGRLDVNARVHGEHFDRPKCPDELHMGQACP